MVLVKPASAESAPTAEASVGAAGGGVGTASIESLMGFFRAGRLDYLVVPLR